MKQKLLAFLQSYSSVPVLLLAVAGISFGLLLPRLGFYFDDWENILTLKVFGLAKMWDYFQGPRPLASWTYFVFAPLVGAWTLGWQLLSLGLRWLTVVTMWWVFCQVWPERKFPVTLAALLFLIYPMFIEQPIAVSYHQHWTAYLLYFVSLALMIRAVREPGGPLWRFWLWTGLAFAASALHLAVLEYFVGVELLRPLVLFFLPYWRNLPPRRRVMQALKGWLPYLGFTAMFIAVRIFYSFRLPADANRPKFLLDLLHSPAQAVGALWPVASKDTLYAFVTAWYKALPLTFFDARRSLLLLTIGAGVLLAALLTWYLTHLPEEGRPVLPARDRLWPSPERLWPSPMLVTGAAAFVLGMLPAWVIYRQASQSSLYMDRYGLPAMFGVSLVWAGLLDWLTPLRARKAILVAVMVALAGGMHLQTADSYALSWQEQVRVAWQLYWRAPLVEPETVFLAEAGFFNYVYPTFMLNTLYHNPPSPDKGLINFFYTHEVPLDPQAWRDGYKIDYIHRNFHFTESGLNSLVLYYQPTGAASCLWLLRPDDVDDPLIPATVRQALALANLERIHTQPVSDKYPAREIFGHEPAHQWCYFYQKAELARQLGDWPAIVELEQQANQQGFTPSASRSNAPHEWLPFILADGHTGRWEQAVNNTLESARVQPRYKPVLCRVWQELKQGTVATPEAGPARDAAYQQVEEQLSCSFVANQ